MDKSEIGIDILYKKMEGTLSQQEEKAFLDWWKEPAHREYFYRLEKYAQCREASFVSEDEVNEAWRLLQSRNKRTCGAGPKIGAVAALVFLLFGLYRLMAPPVSPDSSPRQTTAILPGRQNAILELADGKVYHLKELTEGQSTHIADHIVLDSCRLEYTRSEAPVSAGPSYNKLIVPRGGEFQLSLEDGSKVWLNSESTLTYPETFTGPVREVFLIGEAYFQVARNPACPFVVHSGGQTVRVLGTGFGITAYPDEPLCTTTLVQGRVEVEVAASNLQSYQLHPGIQLVYNRSEQKVVMQAVEVNEYVAWKDGTYVFTRKRLEDILTTLSRWYDFQVFYQHPEAKEVLFSGELKRFGSFDALLRMIEKAGEVKFKINDRVVIVSK